MKLRPPKPRIILGAIACVAVIILAIRSHNRPPAAPRYLRVMAAAVEHGDVRVVRALLQLGVPPDSLREYFDSVRTAATVSHRWTVEEERNVPIAIGIRPRATLQQLWPSLAGRN